MGTVEQRVKALENERELLWRETRALRERIARGWDRAWASVWVPTAHDHSGAAGQGGQLDWDDIWSDAVHDHSSAAEGGAVALAGLAPGTITGDALRYNAATTHWEVEHEPLEFAGLVLTPALASLVDAEGAMYYNSVEKAVLVCTDI